MQVKSRDLKADDEKTQEDRHAARATKKRVLKRKKREQEEAEGVWAHEKGIKSAREDAEAAREAAAMNKRGRNGKASRGTAATGAGASVKTKERGAPKSTSEVFRVLEAAKPNAGAREKSGSTQNSAKFMY
jgi:hypothetical protein